MSVLYVAGIGVLGPGIGDWTECAALLRGELEYEARSYEVPRPEVMSSAAIRRANSQIRLGVAVAAQAVAASGLEPTDLYTVFAASEGDGVTAHEVCSAVTGPEPTVSPTRFHNSVHNAPAGNWVIAVQAQGPSTSLAAYDGSFGVGLVEAAAQAGVEGRSVLLATHDTKGPPTLDELRPLHGSFGIALVLTPEEGCGRLAELDCRLVRREGQESRFGVPGLETLRTGNPAGRALVILDRIARGDAGTVWLPCSDTQDLEVEVQPCF